MPAAAVPPHRPWTIRARLVLLVLSVWLPAALALALLARATFLREEAAARGHMRDAAENLNAAVEAELDKVIMLARGLSASSSLKTSDFDRFREVALSTGLGDSQQI